MKEAKEEGSGGWGLGFGIPLSVGREERTSERKGRGGAGVHPLDEDAGWSNSRTVISRQADESITIREGGS